MTTPSDPQNPGVPDPSQSGSNPGQTPEPGGYTPPPGGGYTPPPAGGYQPPAGGGYTPPPSSGGYGTPPPSGGYGTPPSSGGYGTPPPNYGSQQPNYGSPEPGYGSQQPNYGAPQGNYGAPQANYGAPAAGAYGGGGPVGQFSVGDAISYAWKKFTGNPLPWILVALTWFAINAVLTLLSRPSTTASGGEFSYSVSGPSTIFSIISLFVSIFFGAALVRGALAEIDGQKPGYGSFFQFKTIGAVLITGLLLGLGTLIGSIVCIGGIIFAFFAWFSYAFVIDRDQSPIDAIKSSFSVISKNIGPLFLLALANVGILLVGAILCGVGLIVAYPLVHISATYAYRFFTGGPIAPADAALAPVTPQYPPQ